MRDSCPAHTGLHANILARCARQVKAMHFNTYPTRLCWFRCICVLASGRQFHLFFCCVVADQRQLCCNEITRHSVELPKQWQQCLAVDHCCLCAQVRIDDSLTWHHARRVCRHFTLRNSHCASHGAALTRRVTQSCIRLVLDVRVELYCHNSLRITVHQLPLSHDCLVAVTLVHSRHQLQANCEQG